MTEIWLFKCTKFTKYRTNCHNRLTVTALTILRTNTPNDNCYSSVFLVVSFMGNEDLGSSSSVLTITITIFEEKYMKTATLFTVTNAEKYVEYVHVSNNSINIFSRTVAGNLIVLFLMQIK